MKFTTKGLIAGLVLIAGAAFAEGEASDPTVKAWQELMKANGGAAKVLGDMAGGKTAFDAAAATAAKEMLIADSAKTAAAFETQASDPASEAKPEIWSNWDDFVAKANALNAAATALDASSLEGIQAGMGAIGGACKDCHSTYRM